MARHRHHPRHYRRSHNPHRRRHYAHFAHTRRHNPFGLSGNVVKDSAYNTAGALGSMFISSKVGQSGWMDVLATGASAIGLSWVGKMMGGSAGEEVLKGGLTATIIKLLHQAGFSSSLGLGLYAPSWFGVPTASSQYLRAYNANIGPAPRGQGTIYVASPGGGLLPATVVPGPGGAPTAVPQLPAAGVSGFGYHRFRSRYAGGY